MCVEWCVMKITKMSNFCSHNGIKNDKTLCGFMAVNAYVSKVYTDHKGYQNQRQTGFHIVLEFVSAKTDYHSVCRHADRKSVV